ncbi:unnamed protein product, partial [Pleuronectes platessa]
RSRKRENGETDRGVGRETDGESGGDHKDDDRPSGWDAWVARLPRLYNPGAVDEQLVPFRGGIGDAIKRDADLYVQRAGELQSPLDFYEMLAKKSGSSVATKRLLQLCGLTLVKDCLTRWSSSYQMISRLLEVKDSTVRVADGMDWDFPQPKHTKMLQSDSMSLSLVVPALLDLSAHLSQFLQGTAYRDLDFLAQKMKANTEQRFSCFLDPRDSKCSPLATAACFLDFE